MKLLLGILVLLSGSPWNGRGPAPSPLGRGRPIDHFREGGPGVQSGFEAALAPALSAELGRLSSGKKLLEALEDRVPPAGLDDDMGSYIASYSFERDRVALSKEPVAASVASSGPGPFPAKAADPKVIAAVARAAAPALGHELLHVRQRRDLPLEKIRALPPEIEIEALAFESQLMAESISADPGFYKSRLNDRLVQLQLDKYTNALARPFDTLSEDIRRYYLAQPGYGSMQYITGWARGQPDEKPAAEVERHFAASLKAAQKQWDSEADARLLAVIALYEGADAASLSWLHGVLSKEVPPARRPRLLEAFRKAAASLTAEQLESLLKGRTGARAPIPSLKRLSEELPSSEPNVDVPQPNVDAPQPKP